MLQYTPHSVARFMPDYIIRAVLPPTDGLFSLANLTTFVALLLGLAFLLRHLYNMQNHHDAPFPFMELPPELRDMVYENLLEDPYYPPYRPCPKHRGPSWLPSFNPIGAGDGRSAQRKQSNWLFLANRQIYAEYMEMLCKKTTFHLTVSPENYTAPVTSSEESKKIWPMAASTLKHVRRCDIKLVTTSSMLGVSDPRNMKPDDWALARQMRSELSEVENIRELNLHVKAVGDPLWNPLWVWYHASQSLKTMGSSVSDVSAPTGPKFNRITFALDMWSPGENYLQRNPENSEEWAWWCTNDHFIGPDGGPEVTVRDFCGMLYQQCPTCRPELADEDEEE